MGKRFGRNQKRQMRSQIAEATDKANRYVAADEMNRGLLAEMRRSLERMENCLQTVGKELGQHFYGLPPVKRRIDEHQDWFRLPKPIPMEALRFRSDEELCSLVECAVYDLSMIKGRVGKDPITDKVHVMLETPSGRSFYAVSGSAWQELRRDPKRMRQEFLPMIAEEMAQFIARGER